MSRPIPVAPVPPGPTLSFADPPRRPAPQPLSLVPSSSVLPGRVFIVAAGASLSGGLAAAALAWPLWSVALIALLPWLPLYFKDVALVAQRNPWLALFYVVAVSQGGHVIEHAAQMVQIHVMDLPAVKARGIFGPLDIEWIHFGWNSFILLATVTLLVSYRHNTWLLASLVFAVWHQVEHTWIMSAYLTTGHAGSPGLLAAGGAIGGGLPLKRPDLHFLYNLIETTPLLIAFTIETVRARRTAAIQDASRLRRLGMRSGVIRPAKDAAPPPLVRR